jgi:hypothetical protein
MSNIDKTIDEIDKIKHNIDIILNNQKKMLFFLKSYHYILILAQIFKLKISLMNLNENQDFIVLFLSQVEMELITINLYIDKSLLDLENIVKDQEIIYKHIDSIFNNLTQNIKLLNIELLNIELSNIESNQISTLDSYMKAIVKFNIILNNDAIIKEYIISIREILKKCIMYIEKARVMWYNYKFKINTNTIITTTENKKRKSELLDIDIDVDVSVSVSVDDQDINKDDNEKKFLFSLASECTSECVSESVANLKTKKTKKFSNNEKVITWLKNNTI